MDEGAPGRDPRVRVELSDPVRVALADLGEYFEVHPISDAAWLPFATLMAHETISELVEATRSAIARSMNCGLHLIETRVAASSLQLAVVARLMSVTVGAALCHEVVPVLCPDTVRWRRSSPHTPIFGAPPLRYVEARGVDDAADAIRSSVIDTVVMPFSTAVKDVTNTSDQVLRGNVISAANGAVTVLGMTQPDKMRRGRALVESLIGTRALGRSATFDRDQLRRRNCCLFYRVPGGGVCGDCVLNAALT